MRIPPGLTILAIFWRANLWSLWSPESSATNQIWFEKETRFNDFRASVAQLKILNKSTKTNGCRRNRSAQRSQLPLKSGKWANELPRQITASKPSPGFGISSGSVNQFASSITGKITSERLESTASRTDGDTASPGSAPWPDPGSASAVW